MINIVKWRHVSIEMLATKRQNDMSFNRCLSLHFLWARQSQLECSSADTLMLLLHIVRYPVSKKPC